MLAIKNAVLVMPDHYIPNATLLVEDGKIVDFGKKLPIPENAEILDAQGNFVGPALLIFILMLTELHIFMMTRLSVLKRFLTTV